MRPNFRSSSSLCALRMRASKTQVSGSLRLLTAWITSQLPLGEKAHIGMVSAATMARAGSGFRPGDVMVQVVRCLWKISTQPAKTATVVRCTRRRIT